MKLDKYFKGADRIVYPIVAYIKDMKQIDTPEKKKGLL